MPLSEAKPLTIAFSTGVPFISNQRVVSKSLTILSSFPEYSAISLQPALD
jgi:hypothetical protein